ncbi:MAG: glycosyltransferase [Ilumatobacteraceae bacterium]
MRLLVVTPDYASHYFPLAAVATAARRRGAEVIVATGLTLRARVEADGFGWRPLRLSRGSNAGIARRDDPADDLRAFFAATRDGMVATLRQQADARGDDLLWEPERVAADVLALVDRLRPDAIVVDHLAFSVTLALRAAGRPFTTFVPGHPTQLPVAGEVYGYPTAWPAAVPVDEDALAGLRRRCEQVRDRFTERYNVALHSLSRHADAVPDAFAAHGEDVLSNSPALLHPPGRQSGLPTRHAFLGSCVRAEVPDPTTASWLAARDPGRPFAYVSFGTFLSARDDVLARVVAGLLALGMDVAMATGSADPAVLGPLPPSWVVAPTLPQVTLVDRAAAVVSHGGNNTVTEALDAGSPMVVLPFSTDQFAIAADVERTGLGVALDPNAATAADVARAVTALSAPDMVRRATALGRQLRQRPGPDVAAARLLRIEATDGMAGSRNASAQRVAVPGEVDAGRAAGHGADR